MAKAHISQHPLVKHKLTVLRDVKTDHRSFRELTRELALLLCYEATLDLPLTDKTVTTPMGQAKGYKGAETIGLVYCAFTDPPLRIKKAAMIILIAFIVFTSLGVRNID